MAPVRTRPLIALAALLSLVVGCGLSREDPDSRQSSTAVPTESPGDGTPSDAPGESVSDPAPDGTADQALSLTALFDEPLGDPEVEVARVLASGGGFTRYEIRYRTQGLTISGTVTKPDGEGPFPAVVLNHGLVDPADYTVGQGLVREEEALARAGYVTIHSDYRGYGASDPVRPMDRELRLGYTRDVIQAVRAVRSLDYVDGRVAMVGRSMGGGLALNVLVARPGLVEAAMLISPTSSDIVENLAALSSAGFRASLFARFGTPEESPDFYRGLSAGTFVDRITEPVGLQHGDADDVCPIRWSEDTLALLRGAGVPAELSVYPGEGHIFDLRSEDSIRETVAFVQAHVPTG